MIIKKSEFVTSLAKIDNYVNLDIPEIAFVGRSNVGKSSLINALTNRNRLAKTSSLPGRTRLVNYFLINDRFMLVDLPGYGFAKASKESQKEWQTLISGYLQCSEDLKIVFVLVDIRITPSELDKQMLEYLYYYNIPFKVVATKIDKISRTKLNGCLQVIANELGLGINDIFPVSASSKQNLGVLIDYIDKMLDYGNLSNSADKILAIKPKNKSKSASVSASKTVNVQKGNLPKRVNQSDGINKKNKVHNEDVRMTKSAKTYNKNKKTADSRKDENQEKPKNKTKKTPRYILKKRKLKK